MPQYSTAGRRSRLRLLGRWQLVVHDDDIELGHREERLTAVLGLTGRSSRLHVAGILWPESTDARALASLRRAVLQTQKRSPGLLEADRLTVGLGADVEVDVDEVRRAAGATEDAFAPGGAEELLGLLAGEELLPDWYDDWVVHERESLDQLRVKALERIARHALGAGDLALTVDAAHAASRIDPLLESARELVIRAHLGRGELGSARREFDRYREALHDELDAPPSRTILDLIEPVLAAGSPDSRATRIAGHQRNDVPNTVAAADPVTDPVTVPVTAPPPARTRVVVPVPPHEPARATGARGAVVRLLGVAALVLAAALAVAGVGYEHRGGAVAGSSGTPRSTMRVLPAEGAIRAGQVVVRPVDVAVGRAAFLVRADLRPALVRFEVRGRTGTGVVRTVLVRSARGRLVELDGLDPGVYRWLATSSAASTVSGRLRIPDPPARVDAAAPLEAEVPTPTVTASTSPSSPSPTPATPQPRPSPVPVPVQNPDPRAILKIPARRRWLPWAEEAAMSKSTAAGVRRSALLVALLAGAASLGVVPTAVADATSSAPDRPGRWAGYEISRDGHADGGWIGGYLVDRRPVFVTTPTKEPNRRGYRSARLVDDLGGRRGATHAETARTAWILSKYGGYRDAAQAAAVDASVYDLLVGGRWRTTGERGSRRIHQADEWVTVQRFARIMLKQSRQHAGPYRAVVAATNTDVGGTLAATVTVTDGRGRPAAGLPVTIATAGAAEIDAVTGDDGRAVTRFAASQPGWHRITATVRNVPEHRLHLRLPIRPGQAAAAEGGIRRTLVASTQAAVRGAQALGLQASPAAVLAGSAARVTATVTGDGTLRPATGTLHGPFGSASAAQCAGPTVGTVTTKVSADGDYTLPSLVAGDPGYYVWEVAVDGTPTALPVTACGAVTTVKAVATVSLTALVPEMQPGNAEVRVGLSGLPRFPAVSVTLSVRGPYPTQQELTAAGCSGAIATSVDQKMNGDAVVTLYPYVDQSGWYALQATVPPGELRQGSQSACLALGTVLHVA